MKKAGIIIVSFLLLVFSLAFSASAIDDVTFKLTHTDVFANDNPEFQIVLKNNAMIDKEFKINVVDFNWQLDGNYNKLGVNSGQTRTVDVKLKKIASDINPGDYGVKISISDGDSVLVEKIIAVAVLDNNNVLSVDFKSPAVINPNVGNFLTLSVKNRRNLDLGNVDISVKSEFFEYSKTFNLKANQEILIDLEKSKNSVGSEGDNFARVAVNWNGKKLFDNDVKFSVLKFENFKKIVEPQEGILIFGEKISLINEGNNIVNYPYIASMSGFQRMFSKFTPAPTSVEKVGGKYNLEWNIKIGAGERKSVGYKTDYLTPLIVLIIAFAVLWLVYSWKKHPLELEKKVLSLHTGDGKLFVVKILITLKNKTGAKITNVFVRDIVPRLLGNPAGYGALKPSVVKGSDGRSALLWKIPELASGEEKVLSYKLEIKTGTIGLLSLSGAAAKYGIKGKRLGVQSSNVAVSEKK